MKGTVWQRGRTWTYAFSTGPRDKRKQHTKGGYRTKGLAQKALNNALAEYQRGELVEPSKLTVERYLIDEWLPVASAQLKASTIGGYRHIIDKRLVPHLGDVRLSELTAGQIGRLHQDLRAAGLSERTILHTHRMLSKALEDAARRRLIARNVARDVDAPRPRRTEMRVWTADEVQAFLRATEDDRLGPCWVLALSTGMRRGELLGLRWADVDLDAGQLAVRRSRVAVGYDVVEGEPKSGRARTIALDDGTVAVLRRHRRRQLEERMAWGEAWEDSGAVFTREDGTPLHPQTLAWHYERAVRDLDAAVKVADPKASFPVIRFHDLRHTHATLALQAGVHPKVVQERLGHSSISITLDLYSHVVPGMQEDAAAKVGAMIFGS